MSTTDASLNQTDGDYNGSIFGNGCENGVLTYFYGIFEFILFFGDGIAFVIGGGVIAFDDSIVALIPDACRALTVDGDFFLVWTEIIVCVGHATVFLRTNKSFEHTILL